MEYEQEISVGKPEGKRSLGKPRHSWEDNIKMGIKEIRCENVDWIRLRTEKIGHKTYTGGRQNIKVGPGTQITGGIRALDVRKKDGEAN
jgi:hypothetical protein